MTRHEAQVTARYNGVMNQGPRDKEGSLGALVIVGILGLVMLLLCGGAGILIARYVQERRVIQALEAKREALAAEQRAAAAARQAGSEKSAETPEAVESP